MQGLFARASLLALATVVGCADPVPPAPLLEVTLEVTNEQGTPVAGAEIELSNGVARTDEAGVVHIATRRGPSLLIVRGEGLLAEPVTIGNEDHTRRVRVRVWSDAGGTRWTMHASGDVMLGRRYISPTSGDPLISTTAPETGARAVVEGMRRIFSAADFRTLNLETVVSDYTDDRAYPGKRFILNSLPDTLAALDSLGVDVATLANNHMRDYLDEGVSETIRALDGLGVAHTGATDGTTADEASIVTVKGVRVGTLAWTTVDGSFVNDSYPTDDDPIDPDKANKEPWQYETQSWGASGTDWNIPVTPRRIGSAWRQYKAYEDQMSEVERATSWTSLSRAYPQLQDWVARRGHGGASRWTTSEARDQIEALAGRADVVIVQLHSGYQFQRAPSEYVRYISRVAIDAGANIVICHHPHVLQGLEWYRGSLIVYSLGNFVFDQDFLATFSSALLRTVWQGSELIEARLLPVEIAGYRPIPAVDHVARRTLLELWEMSLFPAESDRGPDGAVRVYALERDDESQPAQLRIERHTARIETTVVRPREVEINLDGAHPVPIPATGLVSTVIKLHDACKDDPASVLLGRDLFGWGHFEDTLADTDNDNTTHWVLAAGRKEVIPAKLTGGRSFLRLTRSSSNRDTVAVRPVARVPLIRHRTHLREDDTHPTARPLDPEPSYSVHLSARLDGEAKPSLRLDLYAFDDTNPTEDPDSVAVAQHEVALALPSDGTWHEANVDLAPEVLVNGNDRANMMLPYLRLAVPDRGTSTFDIDDLALIEWRIASQLTEGYGRYDWLNYTGEGSCRVTLSWLPAAE